MRRIASVIGIAPEKIEEYVALGCRGFYPWCSDYPDTETLRLFARVTESFR